MNILKKLKCIRRQPRACTAILNLKLFSMIRDKLMRSRPLLRIAFFKPVCKNRTNVWEYKCTGYSFLVTSCHQFFWDWIQMFGSTNVWEYKCTGSTNVWEYKCTGHKCLGVQMYWAQVFGVQMFGSTKRFHWEEVSLYRLPRCIRLFFDKYIVELLTL